MLRFIVPTLLLFAFANCSSTVVSASGGRGELGETPRLATGGSYGEESSSTEDIDVAIEQADSAMVFDVNQPVDVKFEITIRNRMRVPVKIERIGLQGASTGFYALEARSRPFKAVIEPATSQKLEFWTSARVTDAHVGAEAPVYIRANVQMRPGEEESRREHFTRQVNGRVTIRIAG